MLLAALGYKGIFNASSLVPVGEGALISRLGSAVSHRWPPLISYTKLHRQSVLNM